MKKGDNMEEIEITNVDELAYMISKKHTPTDHYKSGHNVVFVFNGTKSAKKDRRIK